MISMPIVGTRYLLRFGWLLPAAIAITGESLARFGDSLPVAVFLAVGFVFALTHPWLGKWLSAPRGRLMIFAAILLIAAALVLVVLELTRQGIPPLTFAFDWAALCLLAALTTIVLTWDYSYESVLSDFRIGIFLLVVVVVQSYVMGQPQHLKSPIAYGAILGYGIFGLIALATARRYSPDLVSNDRRSLALDGDWVAGVGAMLLVLAALGLLIAELFGLNVLEPIGTFLASIILQGLHFLAWLTSLLVALIWWVLSFFHVHRPPPHRLPPPGSGSSGQPPSHKKLHSSPMPGWFIDLVRVVGIGGALLIILWSVFWCLQRLSPREVLGGRRERAGSWSWGKFMRWMFGRAREGVADFAETHTVHLPRRRKLDSVRAVYRALLEVAGKHARPRRWNETALEYSQQLTQRWPQTADALSPLNQLYAGERYASRPSSPEAVQRAVQLFRRIEAVIKEDSVIPRDD